MATSLKAENNELLMSCFCDSLTCNEGRSIVRTDNNLVEQVEDRTKELWLRARHPLTKRSPIPRSATLSSSPSSLLLHHLIWLLWLALRESEGAKKCGVFWQEGTGRGQPVLYLPVKSCLLCQAKGCQAPCYYSVNHKNNSEDFGEENLHRAT